MAIPDFQTLMLPLLKMIADKQEHTLREAIETLARQFTLSELERKQLLPSGRQATFDNRVGWAQTYLKKALLLESTGKGRFQITARGCDVLKSSPDVVNMKYLMRFPEYAMSRSVAKGESAQAEAAEEVRQTPEEMLEASYQSIRRDLAQELLERAKKCAPVFFEQLVVDLLVAMGYGGSRKDAGQATRQSNDGGIDGIIKEDKLGLDIVCLQAKRWENTVGRPTVQAFAGSLDGYRANKGVLITTSQFSQDALHYVNQIGKKIVLIDGEQLASLMIDHGVGVAETATYVVKKVDSDYFPDA